jgi:hypothetical protein
MSFSSRALSTSERLYRWLIRLYPGEFRSEYGSEMVQTFRDRYREELGQGVMGVFGLWRHTLFDLVTTAPLEHIKRRQRMNAPGRDLRWDVRYGVEMFFGHARIFFKYIVWLSGAVMGLLAALLLTGLISITLWLWFKMQPLNEAWKQTVGHTPQESYQLMMSRFPKTERSDVARKLEELTNRLGISKPMAGGEVNVVKLSGPFNGIDFPPYLEEQLSKSTDDLDDAPEQIQAYLNTHSADLRAVYDLIGQAGPPRWEMDLSLLVEAPVPNVSYHRQLHGVIALDILEKTRLGQRQEALEAFEASWKISQSLRERPELISQLIANSIADLQAGVLRKMQGIPAGWQKRIISSDLRDSMLEALQFDSLVASRYLNSTSKPVNFFGWPDMVINSPVGGPVRRLVAVQLLEATRNALAELKGSDLCSFDPDASRRRFEATLTSWNVGKMFCPNYYRAWECPSRSMVNLEFTEKVLHVKEVRASSRGNKVAGQVAGMESLLCPELKWVHQISPEGTLLITSTGLPDWVRGNERFTPRFSRLSLTYSFKGRS